MYIIYRHESCFYELIHSYQNNITTDDAIIRRLIHRYVCPRKQHTGTRLRFDQQFQNLLAIITNNIVFINNQRNHHGRDQNIIFSLQKPFNATSSLKVPLTHCSGGGTALKRVRTQFYCHRQEKIILLPPLQRRGPAY